MNKNFAALAKANADHYDEHPGLHTTLAVVLIVVAVVGLNVVIRKLAKKDVESHMEAGRYRK